MAKLNVKVDDTLEDVKLVKKDKENDKKKPKKKKEEKTVKSKTYFQQIRDELKFVTWPSKKNLVKYSITTIAMVILLALFFLGISFIFDIIYGLKQGW